MLHLFESAKHTGVFFIAGNKFQVGLRLDKNHNNLLLTTTTSKNVIDSIYKLIFYHKYVQNINKTVEM